MKQRKTRVPQKQKALLALNRWIYTAFFLSGLAGLMHEVDKGESPPFSGYKKSLCFQMIQNGRQLYLAVKGIHGRHDDSDGSAGIEGNRIFGPVGEKYSHAIAPFQTEL